MRHFFILFCTVFAALPAFAADLTGTLAPSSSDRAAFDAKLIRLEGGNLFATDQTNALLTGGDSDWNGERAELAFERVWPCDIALVARQNPDAEHSYWFLTLCSKPQELEFGRRENGQTVQSVKVPFPAGYDGKKGTLALLFPEKRVEALLDGKKIAELPDDGSLPAGRIGVRGGYHTRVKLLSLMASPKIAAEKNKTVFTPDWSLERAEHQADGTRERISLNHFWQFAPVGSEAEQPAERGFFLVPGHWRGGNISNRMRDTAGRPVNRWRGKELSAYPVAYYRRTFMLPGGWSGRRVELYFENIKGRPAFFLNGKEIASSQLDDSSHRLRIDGALCAGENELTIRIDGSGEAKQMPRNGIFGNAWLESRPEANLGFPRLVPSVARKQLTVTAPASGIAEGSVEIEIPGEAKQVFPLSPEGVYVLEFLPDKLWTPENPVLLTANFTLRDAAGTVLDRFSRRFGFREFSLSDGDFLLNGRPYTLRFDTSVQGYWTPDWHFNETYFRNQLKALKALNINGVYMAPDAPDRLWEVLDETGFLALAKGIPTFHAELNRSGNDAAFWSGFEAAAERMITNPARFNHPSAIGWLVDVWYNYHSGAQNPEYAGMAADVRERTRLASDGTPVRETYGDPNMLGAARLRKETLDRIIGIYRKYAPDAEFFCGASAHAGNLYSTHLYHTWGAPESEMRAFFERWSFDRELPVFGGEICIPYIGSFYEIDKWFGGGKPYFFENAARRIGPRVYCYTPVTTERPFHDKSVAGVQSQHTVDNGALPRIAFHADLYTDLLAASTGRLFPAWRSAGFRGFGSFEFGLGAHYALAGFMTNAERPPLPENPAVQGYKPELFDQYNALTLPVLPFAAESPVLFSAVAPPLRRAFADRTFWIGGAAPDFYNDDHAYWSGGTVKKQLIVLNDTAEERTETFTFLLRGPRGTVAERTLEVSVPASGRTMVPFEFKLPEVAARAEYRVEALRGEERDALAVQVFPKTVPTGTARPLYVFDPEEKLVAYLNQCGVAFRPLERLDVVPPAGSLLLVGRRALAQAGSFDPAEAARNGVGVLVLEQGPEASPELVKSRSREAFLYDRNHPALAGFKDVDFTLWNGSEGLAPAYGISPAGENWNGFGNRNLLATYVWRRPFCGNAVALLAGGFDLGQSPLLEGVLPRASWIGCQLDLTGRLGGDPVATTLFVQLLDYLDRRGAEDGSAAVIGGGLEPYGIAAEPWRDDEATMRKRVWIISSPDFAALEQLQNRIAEFVHWGGRVVYLHDGKEFSPRWLPFALEIGETETRQARILSPGWNRGWDNAELWWHDPFKVPVFRNFNRGCDATEPAVVVRRPFGQGEFWFCSLHPSMFGDHPAAAKVSRLISALLVQNAVPFSEAGSPFSVHKPGRQLDLTDRKWDFRLDPENRGLALDWHRTYDPTGWMNGLVADGLEVRLGMAFEAFLGRNYDGVVWYRLNEEIPEELRNERELYCIVGAIDDFDEIYVNGIRIGSTGAETAKYWEAERIYPIPAGLLKPGKNLIAVRITDDKGDGGIVKGPFRLSNRRPEKRRAWSSPFGGAEREYEYKADMVRMY